MTPLKWCTHTVSQPMLPGCFWRRWRGARESLSCIAKGSPNPKRSPKPPRRGQRQRTNPRLLLWSLVTSDFDVGDHGKSLMEHQIPNMFIFWFVIALPTTTTLCWSCVPISIPFLNDTGDWVQIRTVLTAKCSGLALLAVMLPTAALTKTSVHSYDLHAHILGLSSVVF